MPIVALSGRHLKKNRLLSYGRCMNFVLSIMPSASRSVFLRFPAVKHCDTVSAMVENIIVHDSAAMP